MWYPMWIQKKRYSVNTKGIWQKCELWLIMYGYFFINCNNVQYKFKMLRIGELECKVEEFCTIITNFYKSERVLKLRVYLELCSIHALKYVFCISWFQCSVRLLNLNLLLVNFLSSINYWEQNYNRKCYYLFLLI